MGSALRMGVFHCWNPPMLCCSSMSEGVNLSTSINFITITAIVDMVTVIMCVYEKPCYDQISMFQMLYPFLSIMTAVVWNSIFCCLCSYILAFLQIIMPARPHFFTLIPTYWPCCCFSFFPSRLSQCQVLLPLLEHTGAIRAPAIQDKCLWFLRRFLSASQSEDVIDRTFGTFARLANRYSSLLFANPPRTNPEGHK